MAAPRKYPDELRKRAVRMAVDARKGPVTRPAALTRIGGQLGSKLAALRPGVRGSLTWRQCWEVASGASCHLGRT